MDKLVYTAATGLRAHMQAQAAIANNMANASTTGFRADRVVFDQIQLTGGGASLMARSPTSSEITDADRQQGTMMATGRPLDVAVDGRNDWIAVQAPDGGEAYTRRGDFSVSPSGTLQTGDGFLVMGQSGPITIIPQGDTSGKPQVVDKIKLVSDNGADTVKGLDNLLHVRGGGSLPENLDGKVIAGTLEGSNVNMTQALVDMIENQRSYEVQASLLKNAKDMDEGASSVMRLPA